MLLSEVNVAYYQELMAGMRIAIAETPSGDFEAGQGRLGTGDLPRVKTAEHPSRGGSVQSEWNYSS
jgi:hypothetical protein